MFLDEARIFVKAGDGGAGMVTFRREKYVPLGGPSGGDGGRGGDVALAVDPRLTTLSGFEGRSHFSAQPGRPGGSSNKTGASGDDVILRVPPGTVVRDDASNAILADLTLPEQQFVVARGGRGGRGNARFKTAVNQAPKIAENGEPGEERWIALELRLIADVGIIGVPNAGKSTLLSVVSAARPKIADYPFTTLVPQIAVVRRSDAEMLWADIPGLVEGAHIGVGLGHSFLRHIQRTRVLIHMLDGISGDPVADFHQINLELEAFDQQLGLKPQIVVLNKVDLPQATDWLDRVRQATEQRGHRFVAISALTRAGVDELVDVSLEALASVPATETSNDLPEFHFNDSKHEFSVSSEIDGFHVVGARVERAAAMTRWEFDDAILRFHRYLEASGVAEALVKAGVRDGDTVFIGSRELVWHD